MTDPNTPQEVETILPACDASKSQTPWIAVIVQAVIATILVLVFDEFPDALDYTTFAIVLATIADTSALYVLRFRDPDRARPYRAAGYPWVPALYILANLAIAPAARPAEEVS